MLKANSIIAGGMCFSELIIYKAIIVNGFLTNKSVVPPR